MNESDETNRLKVSIHGTEYILRGYDSISHMKWVAEKVNHLMKDISNRTPTLDERRVAVLSALNLADELYKLQTEYRELLSLLDEKTGIDMKE